MNRFLHFYVYRPQKILPGLSDEPTGTDNRRLWNDLKTEKGAIKRAQRLYPGQNIKIWRYTNFYNKKTFKLVHSFDRDEKTR